MTPAVPSGRTLTLPMELKLRMINHAEEVSPKEACGIIAKAGTDDWKAVQIYEMKNVENTAIGYSMDPKEQLAVERTMRERGQQMLGIYHSHTASEAFPSPVDIRHAISSDIVYVLISLQSHAEPKVRSFQIDGAVVREDKIKFVLV